MLEALASIVLILLMFVPILNMISGAVAGFYLLGWVGAAIGLATGWFITSLLYDPFGSHQR